MAWGTIGVPLAVGMAAQLRQSVAPVQQRILLNGGGFAGRLTPELDLTQNELAGGFNHDHEGANGGWVLPLVPMRECHLQPALQMGFSTTD